MGALDVFRRSSDVQQRADEPAPSDPSEAFVIPTRSAVETAVSVSDALSMSMVYRAIQVLATSIKQLPLHAEKDGHVPTSQPALVRQPNLDQTPSVFFEETFMSLVCQGNAYWLLDQDANGKTINVTVLNPLDVTETHTTWGRVTTWSYKGQDFSPERIKHLKIGRLPGNIKGLGPIQAAQVELRGDLDTRNYASTWFANSGVPAGGYLSSDSALNATQAKQNRDAWTEAANNRAGIPVLGNGLKFNSVFLSPRDAQWIEAQQFNVTQVARLFGIPASLLLASVEGGSQTYSNIEQDAILFTRFSIATYTSEIEEAFSSLLPRGTRAKFNLDALLRTDTKTRYEAHQLAINAGFLTINEVRALEGLEPLPEPKTPPAPAPLPEPEEGPAPEAEEAAA